VDIIRATVHVDEWGEAWCDFRELFDEREFECMFYGIVLDFGGFKLS
jgi:hypothetical protein